MRTELKVFSRLFGKQFKTELSAADDIQEALNELQSLDLNSQVENLRQKDSQFVSQINELKGVAEDLISTYDSLEDQLQEYKQIQDKLETALRSFESMASDLGIDPMQSDKYEEGSKLLEESESDIVSLVDLQNDTYDRYETATDLFR
jgi:chromosome segregation ATPase